jgi:hypothetical protein
MKNLLIIGYGKWAKKIIKNLSNTNVYNVIFIKTKDNYYKYNFNLNKKEKISKVQIKKNDSVHICVPTNQHFSVMKKYLYIKNLSIEKPLFDKLNYFKKVKRKFIKVNYIDLYNPITKFILKDLKEKKIISIDLTYCGKHYFDNQYFFLDEWLDHPLSLLLSIYSQIQIKKIKISKINKIKKINIFEALLKYNNLNIQISLKSNFAKKRLVTLTTETNDKIILDYLKNKIFFNKKLLYKSNVNPIENFFKLRNNAIITQKKTESISFHKRIFEFKRKIIFKSKKKYMIDKI